MTTVLATDALATASIDTPGWVAIEGDRILESGVGEAPDGALDLGDLVLAPGLIDLQVNGIGDVDLVDADADGWAEVGRTLLAHGVTAYCPTFVSAPLDRYRSALERASAARDVADAAGDQAQILGVHLEGPFLGRAGAHRAELLREADVSWLEALVAEHPGLVRIVTLAPEADPGLSATSMLASAGVVVALGHSGATYEDAIAAAGAGATVVTHLFNGMGPLHHREPGLAGAALRDARLTPTVIADLVHVHPAVLGIAFDAAHDTVIVSDAVACTGDVREVDGAARRPDGTLAGATTLLDRALANVVRAGVAVEQVISAATANPAGVLRLDERGTVMPGARADLVALDPGTLAVRAVWLGGEQVR